MKTTTLFFLAISIIMITGARAQDTLVLQPGPEGKDAQLNDYYSSNYGDYPNLFATAGTAGEVPFICRGLFEFDLSAIPAGSEILDARLSLFFANNSSNPYYHYGENDAHLQRVIEPWDEHEVTWWNQPQTTAQNQVSLPVSKYGDQDYTDIDVTLLIQDMVNDPDNSHGILFRLQVEEMYRRMYFASGDHEDHEKWPKLEIIYMLPISINENDAAQCVVYPNPASDEVFFKTPYPGTSTLTLHDLCGREVVRQVAELKEGDIYRLGLPGMLPGIYILRIDMEKDQFYRKLVIAR